MSKMKRLEELTPREFKKLKASGLLKTIYPDTPANYVPFSGRPPLNENPDWSGVINLAESIVKRIEDDEYCEDNDDEVYLYEEVIKALYGDDFFKWKNERT